MVDNATHKQRLTRGLSLIRGACSVLQTTKVSALIKSNSEFDMFCYQISQLFSGTNLIEDLLETIKLEREEDKKCV